MEKIQSTVLPPSQPSYAEWYKEFRVGILAPKPTEGRDRANNMMKLWEDKNGYVDFTHTLKRLELCIR